MTAIFTGPGAGLARGSAAVLGSAGMLGSGSTGRAGENLAVNAATGNLVISRQDEFLVGRGPDTAVSRTYNSLAQATDDNGDKWMFGAQRRLQNWTGTINTAGSTVEKVEADGSVVTYHYSAAIGAYRTTDGAGAYDKLVNVGHWIWTDGDTQTTEVYDSGGTLISSTDSSGNSISYTYHLHNSAWRLSRATTSSGEYQEYIWTGENVTQITTGHTDPATGAMLIQVRTRYAYDGQNRLTAITVDLSPEDSSIGDGKTYVTSYTYHGTSNRVASVVQTDGSRTDIAYDSSGRVTELKETVAAGEVRITRIGYGFRTASVTDPTGELTRLWYDDKGQLLQIVAPPATKGGVSQVRQFQYDADGNLLRTIETDSVNASIPDNLVQMSSWGGGDEADRGDNLVDDGGWPQDVDGTLPANGTIGGSGWTGSYVGETEWTVTPGPYSGKVVSLHAGQADSGQSGGGAQSASFNVDHTKAYEFTLYFKADQLDQHQLFFGLYGDVKNGWDGSNNTNPYFATEYPTAGYGMQAGKWYKMVGYVLPSSTGVESWGSYGGVYDLDTGAKLRGMSHYIWQASAGSALTRFFNYYNEANQGKFTHFYKPEVREVADAAILRSSDKLDVAKDRNLVELPEPDRGDSLVQGSGWLQGAGGALPANGTFNGPGWQTGMMAETEWTVTPGPYGANVASLKTGQTDTSDPGGGVHSDYFSVDHTKAYEFTLYFKADQLNQHYVYFGLNGDVKNGWDGASNTNPYFTWEYPSAASGIEVGKWYKMVAYVLPSSSGIESAGSYGGVYDVATGRKVRDIYHFVWQGTAGSATTRFFNYYNTNNQGKFTHFYKPEVRQVASGAMLRGGDTLDIAEDRQRLEAALPPDRGPSVVDGSGWLQDAAGNPPANGTINGSAWQSAYLGETEWTVTSGPYGGDVASLKAGQTDTGDAGGGAQSNGVAIDKTKAYEFSIYVRADQLDKHRVYFGLYGDVKNGWDGANNTNPYFTWDYPNAASGMEAGKWYKMVGYVLPSSNGIEAAGTYGGVYDLQTGQKVRSIYHFIWQSSAGSALTRFFNYYDTQNQGKFTHFYQPELRQVAGGAILRGNDTLDIAKDRQRIQALGEWQNIAFINSDNEARWSEVTGPDGAWQTALQTGQFDAGQDGGGAFTNEFTIDPTKAYRFTQYFRKSDLSRHNIYFGPMTWTTTAHVKNAWDGAANANPYFLAWGDATQRELLQEDRWYKVVAYVLPEGSANIGYSSLGGVYDATTGARVADVSNFRWAEGRPNNKANARFFTYYDESEHGWSTDWLAPEVVQVANATLDNATPFGVVYDESGRITRYQYDAMGNVTLVDNPIGADVARAYDAGNRVVLETSHGSDENYGAVTYYTSYAYSSTGQLRFRVSPDGKVTEYQYNANGTLANTVEYLGHRYTSGPSITETGMTSWRNSLADKTKRHFTTYNYDSRGQLVFSYDYAAADANGNASSAEGYTLTYYSYDHRGRLLSTNRLYEGAETYMYDGLDRVIASSSPTSGVTSIYFDDANTRTVMHLSSGLNRTLTYNKAGDLVSEIESAVGTQTPAYATGLVDWAYGRATRTAAAPIAGQAAYQYTSPANDYHGYVHGWTSAAAGETVRYRITLKGAGSTTMHRFGLYGAVDGWGSVTATDVAAVIVSGPGRLSQVHGHAGLWQIDGISTTTETTIEIVRTFQTAQSVGSYFYVGGTDMVTAGTSVILSAPSLMRTESNSAFSIGTTTSNAFDRLGRLRVSFDEFDNGNRSYFLYDNAGRKTAEVDDYGFATEFIYDASSRLIGSVRYVNGIDGGHLTRLQDPDNTLTIADIRPAMHAQDQRTWTVYDTGDRVVQTIDGTGVVTAYEYDGQSRVVRTTVFGTRLAAGTVSGFVGTPPAAPVVVTANAAIDSVTRTFYDRDGNLRGTLDGEGFLVEYVYDGAGNRIEEIRYPQAPGIYLGPTASLSQLVGYAAPASPAVRRTRYVYDSRGLLRYQVDAQNQVTRFDYNYAGKLTGTRAYVNPISVSSYDLATVKAATVAHGDDRLTYQVYDAIGRVSYSVDAGGTATYYSYDYAGNVVKVRHGSNAATEQISRNWYDARGNLRFKVDPAGYVTKYVYTVGGRLADEYLYDSPVSVSDATTISQVADLVAGSHSAGTYTWRGYQYDNLGRLVREYDGTGHSTVYGYWGTGLLQSVDAGYGGDGLDRSYTLVNHDAAGRRTSEIAAYAQSEQVTRSFEYDALGNQTRVIDGRGISSYSNYDRRGMMTSVVDGAGGVTRYGYNAFGEVASVIDPRDNVVAYYYYDTLGHLVQADDWATSTFRTYTRFGELNTVTRSNATTYFFYDKMGRVIQIHDALGYNEYFTYNEVGDRTTTTNKLGGTTTYGYDPRGLKTSEVLPMSSVYHTGSTQSSTVTNTFAYDSRGNLVTETRAAGLAEQIVTTHEYDRANRLVHTIGATFHGYTPHTYYAYDARGNLTRITDPHGYRTIYYYDDLDRVSVEISAVGTYTAYTYDANGNVVDIKVYASPVAVPNDGGSQEETPGASGDYRQTTFTYDNANRMLTSSVHGVTTGSWNGSSWVSTTAALTTLYVYDANGNVLKTIDPNGNATWAWYDVLNRKTDQIDALGYRTRWTYDTDGNVTAEYRYANPGAIPTDPLAAAPAIPGGSADDRVTAYAYDKMGNRLYESRQNVKVHDGAGGHVLSHVQISYAYNGLGQVTRKTEATGEYVDYVYDTSGRLSREQKSGYTDYAGTWSTPAVDYYYDGLGNLTRSVQNGNANAYHRITTYGYDGGKLRWMSDAEANDGSAIDGKTTSFWYNLAGQLTVEYYQRFNSSGGSAGGAYSEGVLRSYDGMGRVTQQWHSTADVNWTWTQNGPTTTTTYNAYGEVASVQVGSGALQQNAYDKAGRLVASNAGDGVWKYFGYDKAGNQTVAVTSAGANLTGYTLTSALALAGQTNVNATYTTYGARNLALQVIEEGRELTAATTATLTTQRTYNAFGEVASETGANNATIDYTYNTMGRVIRIESPAIDVVSESGAISYGVRPTEHMYYDAGGRLVAQRDANGNLTRLTLLTGTGYGGSQALVTHETHADGGVKQTKYDVHGDARIVIDEMNRTIATNVYDQRGQVIQSTGASGLTDYYSYDVLGQRLTHWNTLYGSANAEITDYDIQGRVISSRAFGGDTTTTSYGYYDSIGGVGGWQQITTMANGLQSVEQTDIFGRTRYKADLGGHIFDYYYDTAGRLYQLTHRNVASQTYQYFNTGKLKQIAMPYTGQGSAPTTTYGYDVLGNLTSQSTYDALYGTTQSLTASYDLLGRMTSWAEAGNSTTPAASGSITYDANGNVRSKVSTAYSLDANGAAGTQYSIANWFRYDSMNRVVLNNGVLYNGEIRRRPNATTSGYFYGTVFSPQSETITYNAAGQRTSAAVTEMVYDDYGTPMAAKEQKEIYVYDSAGRLTQTRQATGTQVTTGLYDYSPPPGATGNGVLRSQYGYDTMNRQVSQTDYDTNGTTSVFNTTTTYNAKGQVSNTYAYTLRANNSTHTQSTTNYFTDYTTGQYMLGAVGWSSITGTTSSTTKNWHQWWDGAVQSGITATTGSTTFSLNSFGQLYSAYIADAKPRTVTYKLDELGQVIRRDETNVSGQTGAPHEVWYRMGGREIGYVGNNSTTDVSMHSSIAQRRAVPAASPGTFRFGSTWGAAAAEFTRGIDKINSYEQGSRAGSYTVGAGDTLQSLAQRLYGDATLWYKIAEANGLSGRAGLTEGQQLVLPGGVVRSTYNAGTVKPYDPAEAVGDLSPNTPKPPKNNKCGAFGQILLAAVALAVAIVLPQLIPALGPSMLGGGVLGGAASGAIGAAAGSVVSQGVGLATGIQEKFSWKGVALSAISGAIGGGLGASGIFGKTVEGSFSAGSIGIRSGAIDAAVRGMAGSAISQGIGLATGLQSKLDFVGVAAAGVGGAIGYAAGKALGAQSFQVTRSASNVAANAMTGTARAIATAATRSAIEGTSFGDNVMRALPDALGQTIGEFVAAQAAGPSMVTRASREYNRILAADGGLMRLASTGAPGTYLSPAQLLDYLGMARGSGSSLTGSDLDRFEQNILSFIDKWGATERGTLNVALAKNDGLRLVYSALAQELPDFQWTHVGMIVGGEVVRAELQRIPEMTAEMLARFDVVTDALQLIPGGAGVNEALDALARMGAEGASAYLIDKIIAGQVAVVSDIGRIALAYRALGANAGAAIAVANILDSSEVHAIAGMRLQAEADLAKAAHRPALAASRGRDAAIELGIHEQTRLQDVLWSDRLVRAGAMAMSYTGGLNTDIPVRDLQREISDPHWTPFPRPWDLDYRIDIAKNAFNKMHDWVHAPAAQGLPLFRDILTTGFKERHWDANPHRPVWKYPNVT